MELDENLVQIVGGAWTAQKLLGPSLEYLGGEIKQWTELRIDNLRRIFANAADKVKNGEEVGAVPPRVLRQLLNDGSFCDDQLFVEYFGGLLAGSRTNNPSDDRSLTMASMVSRLSTYQIRAHYLLYAAARKVYSGTGVRLNERCDLQRASVFLPMETFCYALDIPMDITLGSICPHVLGGLEREGIVGHGSGWGLKKTDILARLSNGSVDEPGVIMQLNSVGIELFLAAHGWLGKTEKFFLNSENVFEVHDSLNFGGCGAVAVLVDN